jgi:hypothetical protein
MFHVRCVPELSPGRGFVSSALPGLEMKFED